MAKSKALIAAEARLSIARQVYINQRARIAELEALLATRGHIATPRAEAAPCAEAAPVVSRFTRRDGSVWEKTRLGNQTRSRCVQPAIILGAQHAC